MLTTRQIEVLSYFLSKKEWVTSEQLSAKFNLNKKTVQNEVKNIIQSFGDDCAIITNHNKGYYLTYLSDKAQDFIRDEVLRHGGENSLGLRPSALVLYLLFQSSYVSMQHIADKFYMSKTAVSLELETVRRWGRTVRWDYAGIF